jgi:hypothetical protein
MRIPRPLALGLLALVLASCSDDGVFTLDPGASPTTSTSPSAGPTATAPRSASPSPAGTMRTTVYYLHDVERGPRLQKEVRTVPRSTGTIRAAVDAMLHLAPLDPDYTSLWPRGTTIRGVSVAGDTATVDLGREAATARTGSEYEAMSLQQLVWTVTAVTPTVTKVRLLVEGRQDESLWGHASYRGSMTRRDHNDVLAPVSVETPANGATVTRTLTFGGTANTFEANVVYRVTRTCAPGTSCSPGQLGYASSHTTASSGTGTRGTWSVTLALPPHASGNWVEIRAFESSAQDGSEQFADTKVVKVA